MCLVQFGSPGAWNYPSVNLKKSSRIRTNIQEIKINIDWYWEREAESKKKVNNQISRCNEQTPKGEYL